MGVGRNTFIHSLLAMIGFTNVLQTERYPELSEGKIKELNPEVIFLSSEPYPFNEQHLDDLKGLIPKTKIILVDGEMFSWYGSRLLKAPDYFKSLVI